MNKTQEALKLALEALEKLWNIIDDIDTYGDMAKADEKLYRSLVERRQRTRFEETGISTDGYTLNGGAITAIREALAEQPAPVAEPHKQPEPCQCPECQVTPHASDCAVHNEPAYPNGACNCRAQPVQEPVAYDKTELNCFAQDLYDKKMREGKHGHYESMFHVIHQCIKKVAPPANKPLTDEEIDNLPWGPHEGNPMTFAEGLRDFARAIEAKLKEKNNG